MSSAAPRIVGLRRPLPPLAFTLPDRVEKTSTPKRARSARGVLAGVAMYAVAVWMAVDNTTFRHLEAKLITPIAGALVGSHGAVNSNDLVYFALGTPRAFGLQITNECTSALLLIPLLVMMGSFAAFTGLGLLRELLAVFVGAVIIVAVNALRVTGIAYATWQWGFDPGYNYSHVFVGSAFSLIGFVGAMLTALWILVRGDRKSAEGAPAWAQQAMALPAAVAHRPAHAADASGHTFAMYRLGLVAAPIVAALGCVAIVMSGSLSFAGLAALATVAFAVTVLVSSQRSR